MNDFVRLPLHSTPAGSGCVIDCDTCTVRGDACTDCVVSVMLGGPPDMVAPDEERALGVLAGLGLVPPLQMTPPAPPGPPPAPAGAAPSPAETAPAPAPAEAAPAETAPAHVEAAPAHADAVPALPGAAPPPAPDPAVSAPRPAGDRPRGAGRHTGHDGARRG